MNAASDHVDLAAELLERGVTHRDSCARMASDYNDPCTCARTSITDALARVHQHSERFSRTLLTTLKLRPVAHQLRCAHRVSGGQRPCNCRRDQIEQQLLATAP